MTEAAYLLRHHQNAIPRLMELIENGLVECATLDANAGPLIAAMARKYANLRPDLADLSLIHIADRLDIEVVFSLDRRDFAIYRNRKGRPFRLLPV